MNCCRSVCRGGFALFLLTLILLLTCAFVRAADPEWKVGIAQVKITPERPVLMAGYANRTKPFTKVTADLYAKALFLEDRTGRRAVLVTSDLIGFPAEVAEAIGERISAKTGLKRSEILLSAAHNHAGPQVSLKPSAKDAPDAAEAGRGDDLAAFVRREARSILIASAPQTAGMPSPRATTAAWAFVPPALVRMPWDEIIPW